MSPIDEVNSRSWEPGQAQTGVDQAAKPNLLWHHLKDTQRSHECNLSFACCTFLKATGTGQQSAGSFRRAVENG